MSADLIQSLTLLALAANFMLVARLARRPCPDQHVTYILTERGSVIEFKGKLDPAAADALRKAMRARGGAL